MKLVKQPTRMFVGMKKAVLREDLMVLTGDLCQSMVLGQMIYWTKTLDKINDWLFEENKRLAESDIPQHDYNYGWIWKSAREMKEDLMNAFSEDAIQRAFTALTNKGILMKRNNPFVRYDRKLHYRVDLVLLRRLLRERGFEMTDFQLASIPQEADSIPHGAECTPHSAGAITEISKESIIERTPIVPLEGDSNLFQSEKFGLAQGAIAHPTKSDDLNSRPPKTKADTTRASRKSPPQKPEDVTEETWQAWCEMRKTKRASISTPVINLLRNEAEKAGWSINSAMQECVLRNWQGFKAAWLEKAYQQEKQSKGI